MGIHILQDHENDQQVFICSTTDVAFGPVLHIDLDLNNFLQWMENKEDIRTISNGGIWTYIRAWKDETTLCNHCAKANKSCSKYPAFEPDCIEFKLDLNQVEIGSIRMGGMMRCDYPDFVDAYPESAEFTDGKPLNDDQLYELQQDDELMNKLALEQFNESCQVHAEQKADHQMQCRKEEG